MANIEVTYIVPAGLLAQALAKCNTELHPGLLGMFTTPVIRKTDADGANPTHYITSGWLSEEEVAYLNAQLPGPFESSLVADENPHAMLKRLGRKLKPGTI